MTNDPKDKAAQEAVESGSPPTVEDIAEKVSNDITARHRKHYFPASSNEPVRRER